MPHCRSRPSSMHHQHLLSSNPLCGRVLRNNLALHRYQRRSRKLQSALCCMPQNGLCVDQAWELLKKLTKADIRGQAGKMTADSDARWLLRQAVQVASTNPATSEGWDPSTKPPEILLGILSSDIRLAVRALRDWTNALSVPFVLPKSRVEGISVITSLSGSVYIKYNAVSQQCYVTGYTGKDRGVLMTLGGTLIGHLPLGLFDESMQHAPPPLGG